MQEPSVYFTDASYSPQTKLGVLGMMRKGDNSVTLKYVENIKNTQCEIDSFMLTLEYAYNCNDRYIKVYTDCSNVENLITNRNERREQRYPVFYKKLDMLLRKGMIIDVETVKGHSPQSKKTADEKMFSIVDKAVRKQLRDRVKDK